jgi:CheY-like chemotaxis protein
MAFERGLSSQFGSRRPTVTPWGDEDNVSRVRVLLVDENDDFLDGLAEWLAGDARLQLAGKAHSGRAALEQVERLEPDLVLMDAAIPDMNGFEVTRQIKSRPKAPLIVLLTFYESTAARLEAWAAGANGFVCKAEIAGKLMPVVQELIRQRQEAAATGPSKRKEGLSELSAEKPGPPPDLSK